MRTFTIETVNEGIIVTQFFVEKEVKPCNGYGGKAGGDCACVYCGWLWSEHTRPETFEEINERRIRARLRQLFRQLRLKRPGVDVGRQLAHVVNALGAKYGSVIWEQLGQLFIRASMEAHGWCPFHELGEGTTQAQIVDFDLGMCAACVAQDEIDNRSVIGEE